MNHYLINNFIIHWKILHFLSLYTIYLENYIYKILFTAIKYFRCLFYQKRVHRIPIRIVTAGELAQSRAAAVDDLEYVNRVSGALTNASMKTAIHSANTVIHTILKVVTVLHGGPGSVVKVSNKNKYFLFHLFACPHCLKVLTNRIPTIPTLKENSQKVILALKFQCIIEFDLQLGSR